jgi:hypothetical protein
MANWAGCLLSSEFSAFSTLRRFPRLAVSFPLRDDGWRISLAAQAIPFQAIPFQAIPLQAIPLQAIPLQAIPSGDSSSGDSSSGDSSSGFVSFTCAAAMSTAGNDSDTSGGGALSTFVSSVSSAAKLNKFTSERFLAHDMFKMNENRSLTFERYIYIVNVPFLC